MVEKLIPNYDFVKNWSENQLNDSLQHLQVYHID